jgi:repressor of nif and glnA expression
MGLQNVPANHVNILRVLKSNEQPSGARVIARRLHEYGTHLTEPTVRYHLRMLDERGLTRLVNRRGGREITRRGSAELDKAL